MAEDQNVNGDRWTTQSSKLFAKAGWNKIADSNIDINGTNGLKHGIDSLYLYDDGFALNRKMPQGVFLEAKRYSTTSFAPNKLEEWVQKLDTKIRDIRMSDNFFKEYPEMETGNLINGILVIWFHDTDNYTSAFKEKFRESLISVRTPKTNNPNTKVIRLFILENDKICQIASVLNAIDSYHRDEDFKFYYPSSARHGGAGQELKVLNLEYMFSKFIFGKIRKINSSNSPEITDVVFYFGDIDMTSFHILYEALLSFEMINSENPLILYKFNRSDNFRKIEPEINKLFKEAKNFTLRDMEQYKSLPSWIE